jgi:transcriptional regulator with XRE-family HTH domain
MSTPLVSPLGTLLREWRSARGKSQLALAVHAGVSSRHLSFIETGRASPSRDMVLLLSDALEIPLRERNALLEAAGFAPMFRETSLEDAEMEQVKRALGVLVHSHGDNPAVLVNRRCDILMSNAAALSFLQWLLPAEALGSGVASNMIRLIFSPDGARPFLENWHDVASELAYRLRRDLLGADDGALRAIVGPDVELPTSSPALTTASRRPSILLPLRLRRGDVRLNLFSTVTTIDSPLDVTLQELRVEAMFPADDESARQLAAIVSGSMAS